MMFSTDRVQVTLSFKKFTRHDRSFASSLSLSLSLRKISSNPG
jgi:hypothetical protein